MDIIGEISWKMMIDVSKISNVLDKCMMEGKLHVLIRWKTGAGYKEETEWVGVDRLGNLSSTLNTMFGTDSLENTVVEGGKRVKIKVKKTRGRPPRYIKMLEDVLNYGKGKGGTPHGSIKGSGGDMVTPGNGGPLTGRICSGVSSTQRGEYSCLPGMCIGGSDGRDDSIGKRMGMNMYEEYTRYRQYVDGGRYYEKGVERERHEVIGVNGYMMSNGHIYVNVYVRNVKHLDILCVVMSIQEAMQYNHRVVYDYITSIVHV